MNSPGPTESNRAADCDRSTVTRLVDEFFAAWNAADAPRVARLFPGTFEIQDGTPGGRNVVRQTGELEAYLAARFAQGDVFSEVAPSIPEAPSASGANAIASFKRRVGSANLHGNAKFVCGDGRIVGLVMSAE